MKLGAHKSIAGGWHKSPERVADIGGNCLQIFSVSPRQWSPAEPEAGQVKKFKKACEEHGIGPVYFHASYLINLADTSSVGHLSKKSLIAELKMAKKLGVEGSVIHPGTFKTDKDKLAHECEGYEDFLENIEEVLENTPEETLFIAENSGNNKIGKDLDELAHILEDVDSDRMRVCLDTCHLHATGHDLSSADKLNKFLDEFDEKIGLENLELIHTNDSRDELGSFRDRHANIGEGNVDKKVFELILNHPDLKDIPFIIETPGFDGNGPDKRNLDILKRLRTE